MNKEFEKPVLSIPLGSMVRINMEPLSAHNRNREFESGSYISDDPCLPSDYERINFLLVNYYNDVLLFRVRRKNGIGFGITMSY